jgi:SAM-dependent methyltransferase
MASPRDHPSGERNKQPILEVLQRVLPPAGTVLEIASGTGQHVMHFARALPKLIWQPSEADAAGREAIHERLRAAPLANVREPLALDVHDAAWPRIAADAIVCINMIHVAPWTATEGLLEHAGRVLASGKPLILYGPYQRGGRHTAPSNEAFDASLRARDPAWGVRDLGEVTALAQRHGFELAEVVEMPANNLTVVLRRVVAAEAAPT